jgi:hypothetical protein
MKLLASRDAMMRVGVVASVVAFGMVAMVVSWSRYDFSFFKRGFPDSRSSFSIDTLGAATWTLMAGLVVIWAVCLGTPWIMENIRPQRNDDKPE